ncbi:MAG: hypothetical protein ACNA7Z_07580 [Dethiobacteria bacterium]
MQKIIKQGREKRDVVSRRPLISFYLGLGSIAALFVSVAVAISFEVVGAVSLFRGFVFPLSAAAVVVSLVARNRTDAADLKGRRLATPGLIFGAIALGLVIFTALAALIIFLPLLGA